VQFLRGFRDNHILATASGSSFMNVFNVWYYSFSPTVAEYERGQPWLQESVRMSIYPLLGILQASEKAYALVPGEYGALFAGLLASTLVGAVYLTPIAFSIKKVRKQKLDYRLAAGVIAALVASVVASIAFDDSTLLAVTTSSLVLATMAIAAICCANNVARLIDRAHRVVGGD
jgi:peptide/nickel transport system substrate-binding protein